MFRITMDPSSESFIQCLAKITVHYSAVHTRTTLKYAAITPTTSMPTDTIEQLI